MAVNRPGRRAVLALLLGVPLAPAYADGWTDLWLRHDQQGDRALRAGHPDQAIGLYRDARRRGYAELEAGQFAAAARDLEPYRDPLAEYDRGNALARQGLLQPSLEAYEAALARAAAGTALARDARHNRDLVAKALQQQPPPPGKGGTGTQGKAREPASKPDGESRNSGMNQSAEQNASPGQDGLGQASGSQGNSAAAEPRSGDGRARGGQDAAHDAAAAGAARGAQGEAEGDAGRRAAAAAARAGGATESEQSIAREQWLRQIPDDPAGLLRRKFMIEHLMREQEIRP